MSNMNFDAIESNKFWQNIVRYIVFGVLVFTAILTAANSWETQRMLAAGYEYRRVPVQTTASYSYQWVKVGSLEYKESLNLVTPQSEETK